MRKFYHLFCILILLISNLLATEKPNELEIVPLVTQTRSTAQPQTKVPGADFWRQVDNIQHQIIKAFRQQLSADTLRLIAAKKQYATFKKTVIKEDKKKEDTKAVLIIPKERKRLEKKELPTLQKEQGLNKAKRELPGLKMDIAALVTNLNYISQVLQNINKLKPVLKSIFYLMELNPKVIKVETVAGYTDQTITHPRKFPYISSNHRHLLAYTNASLLEGINVAVLKKKFEWIVEFLEPYCDAFFREQTASLYKSTASAEKNLSYEITTFYIRLLKEIADFKVKSELQCLPCCVIS